MRQILWISSKCLWVKDARLALIHTLGSTSGQLVVFARPRVNTGRLSCYCAIVDIVSRVGTNPCGVSGREPHGTFSPSLLPRGLG